MTNRLKISYKGEHIASGVAVNPGYMFWSGVLLDDEYDPEAVAGRLARIWESDRIHSNQWGARRFHFAPAFTAERDDSLAVPRD